MLARDFSANGKYLRRRTGGIIPAYSIRAHKRAIGWKKTNISF
jgi:hypothetical protein